MSDRETIEVYNRQVEKYADVMVDSTTHKMLQSFISRLEPQAEILDLGCGPGNFSAHMRDRGLNVDPVDASPEMVKFANDTHGINARVGVFADLDAIDHYDGVWASFSLLHATRKDFPGHLNQIHTSLKPNGLFYIGMKLGEQPKRDQLGRYYTYYEEAELKTFLENAGFSLVEVTRDEGVGLAGDVSAYIEIIAQKT